MAKITVGEKALAHLSRGLYRSPASAIRELISNAWDANATEVRINTGYPNFYMLTVEDNGDGFTRAEFKALMQGGIGNSTKRPVQRPLGHSRPTIGRLGIGMLGIAQICGGFTITSRPEVGQGFKARVQLYDMLKERLDEQEGARVDEVDVGEYWFRDLDPEPPRQGTLIIADDVHPTFVRSFQRSLDYERYVEPSLDWLDCLDVLAKVRSLQELGDYWRFLWELAAAAPIPYVNADALPDGVIAREQRRLLGYQFRVLVDGIELRKPVLLKGNPGGYTTTRIAPQKLRVYGKDLRFHGYVVVQDGVQLRPDELRGIMIRVKNVGIGYYDQSMLDYRINEGPRSRWLTGEVFVDEGLEDALNIDRDSFNRFHPEYRAVQEHIHGVLQREVFPRVYKQIDVRSRARAKKREKTRYQALEHVISASLDAPAAVELTTREDWLANSAGAVTRGHGPTRFLIPAPDQLRTKKTHRQLASAILALYDVASLQGSHPQARERFARLLLDLLARW